MLFYLVPCYCEFVDNFFQHAAEEARKLVIAGTQNLKDKLNIDLRGKRFVSSVLLTQIQDVDVQGVGTTWDKVRLFNLFHMLSNPLLR